MVAISGFTIVRNAVRLAFPIEAAIRSLLPVCEEVVVNVGRSDDGTLDLIRSIDDPRIRVIETDWDMTIRDKVLADETLRAMRACRHPWGIYIQADEVLHERGADALGEGIRRWDADPRVEGLLVDYLHFYGGFDTLMANRRWYRHEVRAVRLDPALDIHPFRDAQGFRVGPENRKVRAKLTGARMFHYGWARPAHALHAKRALDSEIWQWSDEKKQRGVPLLGWAPGLRAYRGDHPAAAAAYVARWREDPDRRVAPPVFRVRFLRYWISDIVERVTGIRVFEYRNYRVV